MRDVQQSLKDLRGRSMTKHQQVTTQHLGGVTTHHLSVWRQQRACSPLHACTQLSCLTCSHRLCPADQA
jgi:hypothetical protein